MYSMNQILPGLFLGSLADSRDRHQIKENSITHIVSIIDSPKIHFKVKRKNIINFKIFIYNYIDIIGIKISIN